jgi:transcription termination factor Rho
MKSQLGDLGAKTTDELRAMALEKNLKNGIPVRRTELILELLTHAAEENDLLLGAGILDVMNDGYGFLRQPSGTRGSGSQDIYVAQSQVRRFNLRTGDLVAGQVQAPKDNERYYGLLRIEVVNGQSPDAARQRPRFEDMTPMFPEDRFTLTTTPKLYATRLIDMVSPIGKGQRALIVSPPKAGKTILLKQIADGIAANHPDVHLLVALIGERPEEVTDMRRSIDGEVFSSTFDEPVEDHCRAAEVALDRAKRLVESGADVVILVDSLTRLARAYNIAVPSSGKTLSGGMDPNALYPPKRFFGAARNVEKEGSLTIVATCLIDTGSRLDDLIYEEFKGTGNMELHLNRGLAERRIYPAIDIQRSGTRREELLLNETELRQVWLLRRMVSIISNDSGKPEEGTERVIERLSKTQTNEEFLASLMKPEAAAASA